LICAVDALRPMTAAHLPQAGTGDRLIDAAVALG